MPSSDVVRYSLADLHLQLGGGALLGLKQFAGGMIIACEHTMNETGMRSSTSTAARSGLHNDGYRTADEEKPPARTHGHLTAK